MLHNYSLVFLCLFFAYTNCNDMQKSDTNRTIVPSRSIYDLVQIRRAASRLTAYYNKTHRKNHPDLYSTDTDFDNMQLPKSQTNDLENIRQRFLIERLQIIIIFTTIALISMIVIVISCIVARYYQGKNPISTETIQQGKSLNPSKQAIIFSQTTNDTRIFTRKSRTLPANV
ncbi:hypothetical protein I4U23_009608 [Adineta vaga]|nr:hypothetical protein I4U23_009608 [Adineta vaga]